MEVKLHRMQRQAVRVRMVFAVLRQALLAEFGGPGLKRQTVGQQGGQILKRPRSGSRRRTEPGGRNNRCSWCGAAIPDSRQVRMAIRGSWSGRGEVRLSIGSPRRAGCW